MKCPAARVAAVVLILLGLVAALPAAFGQQREKIARHEFDGFPNLGDDAPKVMLQAVEDLEAYCCEMLRKVWDRTSKGEKADTKDWDNHVAAMRQAFEQGVDAFNSRVWVFYARQKKESVVPKPWQDWIDAQMRFIAEVEGTGHRLIERKNFLNYRAAVMDDELEATEERLKQFKTFLTEVNATFLAVRRLRQDTARGVFTPQVAAATYDPFIEKVKGYIPKMANWRAMAIAVRESHKLYFDADHLKPETIAAQVKDGFSKWKAALEGMGNTLQILDNEVEVWENLSKKHVEAYHKAYYRYKKTLAPLLDGSLYDVLDTFNGVEPKDFLALLEGRLKVMQEEQARLRAR